LICLRRVLQPRVSAAHAGYDEGTFAGCLGDGDGATGPSSRRFGGIATPTIEEYETQWSSSSSSSGCEMPVLWCILLSQRLKLSHAKAMVGSKDLKAVAELFIEGGKRGF